MEVANKKLWEFRRRYGIQKMWYIYRIECYSVMRMKKLKLYATMSINSTNMIMSKISPTKECALYDSIYVV